MNTYFSIEYTDTDTPKNVLTLTTSIETCIAKFIRAGMGRVWGRGVGEGCRGGVWGRGVGDGVGNGCGEGV